MAPCFRIFVIINRILNMILEVLSDEQGTYFYLRASTNMFPTYQVRELPRMQGLVPTAYPICVTDATRASCGCARTMRGRDSSDLIEFRFGRIGPVIVCTPDPCTIRHYIAAMTPATRLPSRFTQCPLSSNYKRHA